MPDDSPVNTTVPELSGFRGERISPGDEAYDEARTIYPGGFEDRLPAAIFRPTSADDVALVVGLARETGLPLAVKNGGHNGAGHAVVHDGIVLDVDRLNELEIDAEARTAWTGVGVKTGEYSKAAWEHRLVTGFGDAGTVGIGGITLYGGIGFFARSQGMTIDSLLAAEVVTADGEVVIADAENEPDLFWALRGGGGNFGVATRLKFRLHPVPEFYGGMLLLPATAETVAGVIAAAKDAPEELTVIANVMPAPPMPFVPEEHHGKLVVMVMAAFAGPAAEGEKALAPFRELAEPLTDMVAETDYPELFPPHVAGMHPIVDIQNNFGGEFGPAEAEAIVDALANRPGANAVVQLRPLGGAMGRVPADATAFAHRDRDLMVSVVTMYMPGEEPGSATGWVEDLAARLKGADGAYAGFVGDEGPERVRHVFPGATYDRLAEVKHRYDPDNVFRLNQNVVPAAG